MCVCVCLSVCLCVMTDEYVVLLDHFPSLLYGISTLFKSYLKCLHLNFFQLFIIKNFFY